MPLGLGLQISGPWALAPQLPRALQVSFVFVAAPGTSKGGGRGRGGEIGTACFLKFASEVLPIEVLLFRSGAFPTWIVLVGLFQA